MGIYIIKDNDVVEYQQTSVEKEIEIEEFLEKHPKVLDKDIFIIGRQVPTSTKTRIDLMGLDKDGNVVLIEIKKSISVREVVSQILEYGVWAEDIQYEDLNRIAKKNIFPVFRIFTKNMKLISVKFLNLLIKIKDYTLLLKKLIGRSKTCVDI